MKSEHRHELQTNELGRIVDQVGGVFDRYANQIMIGACAVAVAAAAFIYWSRTSRARDASAWSDLAGAHQAEEFLAVWEAHPGTIAAQWARLQEGEARLGEGIQLSFNNLESARKELQKARDVLQAAVDQHGAPAAIRERALFALGRCLEALSEGKESDAVKMYGTLVREFPNSIYKKDAEARIAGLNSSRGQEFYAWFSSYERPKAPELRPRDKGAAGDLNEDLNLDELLPGRDADKPKDNSDGSTGPNLKLQLPGSDTPADDAAKTPPASDEKDRPTDNPPP